MDNKEQQKQAIRCLFISKNSPCCSTYDIGIIANDFTFCYIELKFSSRNLTRLLQKKLRQIWQKYVLTKKSDVMVLDTIAHDDPVYLFFSILSEYAGFNFRTTNYLAIPKRILTFHKSYLKKTGLDQVKKSDVFLLWNKLLETERCPWITTKYNAELKLLKKDQQDRIIFLRMALYYMLIKQHLYTKFKNSRGYKMKTSKISSTV